MRCPRCEHDNAQEARFCSCGARLPALCPSCAHASLPESRFCSQCRTPIESPARAAIPSASPQAYTPRHLPEKILSSRSALKGERKQVTVLFCDVVESFRLAGRLDPEAMHEVMNRILRLMAEAVHRYQGTVNQFLGDGLMALFGAPVAIEDHAFGAVQAALAIHETISGYSEQMKQERDVEIHLRQGLNTGLVVVEALTEGDCVVDLARTHLAWAQVLLGRGDAGAARGHIETARERFEASGLSAEAGAARDALTALVALGGAPMTTSDARHASRREWTVPASEDIYQARTNVHCEQPPRFFRRCPASGFPGPW